MNFINIVTKNDMNMQRALKKIIKKSNINNRVENYMNLDDILNGVIQQDIIFLDIDNCGLKNAQILRKRGYLRDIIFYASTREFAFQSFSFHPFDYLLKPLDEIKLENVLNQYLLFHNKFQKNITIRDSRNHPKFTLSIHRIEYIESSNTRLNIHLINKEIIHMYAKLSDIENEINDNQFLRCHQSYLVNMNYITQIKEVFEMSSGAKVPIRVRNKSQIKEIFYQYLLENI